MIASPPLSEKFGGMDLLSSINMPSGVAPTLVIYAENAALAVAKIFALKSEDVRQRVIEYQRARKEEIYRADEEAKSL